MNVINAHYRRYTSDGAFEVSIGYIVERTFCGSLVRCQDAICQQAQATEIGETRSLGDSRQHGQV